MNIKNVFVLKDGHKLRNFTCELVDITKKSIQFFGCHTKTRPVKRITINYYGNLSTFTDWPGRECIINLENEPGIQLLIQW